MESTRKLAAIMFTDIQGYTALMQTDEAKALEMRNRHREVFQRLHKEYNGTILQYYGDGTLSVFDSAIDAAQCGVEMQKELRVAWVRWPADYGYGSFNNSCISGILCQFLYLCHQLCALQCLNSGVPSELFQFAHLNEHTKKCHVDTKIYGAA